MIETVLTIQKTVNNLFGVNPFFGPNLTILQVAGDSVDKTEELLHEKLIFFYIFIRNFLDLDRSPQQLLYSAMLNEFFYIL